MKKLTQHSVALLALSVAAASGIASADVTVYGRAHVSVDMLDDGADYGELNLSSNSSRLGFKAQKETESGITGLMQIEGEITYNQGGSTLSSRDTFVGIKGDFGMLRGGQFDTPFKRARGPANLFGDQAGDMRNLTRVGDGRFDERTPNTLHYQTPSMSGVQLNLAYSLHEGNDAPDTSVDGVESESAVSVSVTYKNGPLDLALAHESHDEGTSRGERSALRFAIGYGLTDDLTLVGFYQSVDHDEEDANGDGPHDADVMGLGAEYKLTGATRIKGMYLTRSADIEDSDSSLMALGVEHRLDRSLRVYANYAMVDNDDGANLTPWNQARTTGTAGAAGETATALSLGLRYDF